MKKLVCDILMEIMGAKMNIVFESEGERENSKYY